MPNHPIESLMTTAMENLKEMVDINTIVGDPIQTQGGDTIIPISKVGFGFASGGSEFEVEEHEKTKADLPFGGGSGAGVSITPVAFLVVGKDGVVKTVTLDSNNSILDRAMDMLPQMMDKIQGMMGGAGQAGKNQNKQQLSATDPFISQ